MPKIIICVSESSIFLIDVRLVAALVNVLDFYVTTDTTVELRGLGVPWTLHCWMHALAAAHELQLDDIVDQLLHDFLEICPDDYSSQFIFECLPLLFNIFRYSKVRVCGNVAANRDFGVKLNMNSIFYPIHRRRAHNCC